jgi:hypothetical protein
VSYNLFAEGESLDWEDLATFGPRHPRFELFPIPAERPGERDALGVALPLESAKGCSPDEPRALIRELWASRLRVFDLFAGEEIDGEPALTRLLDRLLGDGR